MELDNSTKSAPLQAGTRFEELNSHEKVAMAIAINHNLLLTIADMLPILRKVFPDLQNTEFGPTLENQLYRLDWFSGKLQELQDKDAQGILRALTTVWTARYHQAVQPPPRFIRSRRDRPVVDPAEALTTRRDRHTEAA